MRILVVDDNDQIREMLRLLLEQAAYEVLEAANGKFALKLLKQEQVDVIVTDIIMPEMEGIDLIMAIRSMDPGAKIIAISGGGRVDPHLCLSLADELGADRVLQKPFGKSAILSMVAELLGNDLNRAVDRSPAAEPSAGQTSVGPS
jgi:CheY-like chemotaxis protein